MNILGIVASPRKLGNSEILVKEMLASLPVSDSKEMLRTTELKIEPCHACYACLAADKNCIIQDDLSFFLNALRKADAVIIGTPCYFLGSHTSLKTIGDRLISIMHNTKEFAGKKCVIAVSYGIAGWAGYAREAVLNFAHFLHLDVVGIMTIEAANPGEAAAPGILEQARTLAARLLNQETPALTADNTLTCAECNSSLLQITTAGTVLCPMCGATGILTGTCTQPSIQFSLSEHPRFSSQGLTEHALLLEQKKAEFLHKRTELYGLRQHYKQYDHWWIKR